MEKIVINGGRPLYGDIEVSGMKNAAGAILIATLLVSDKCIIENLPCINDVATTLEILRHMNVEVRMLDKNTVEIDTRNAIGGTSPLDLVRRMRSSYYLYGAELGRYGRAYAGYPGGCDFGVRPIDQHIKGFEALGATVTCEGGYVEAVAPSGGLRGANIFFDLNTVGGTINVMLAAVRAKGTTIIENAAREPHVVDVANFLNTCGANITGAGTDTIRIKGVDKLKGCTYAIIPDMIEAGTYMIAAAATKGRLRIKNVIPKHLESISAKLEEMGVSVEMGDDYVTVWRDGPLYRVNVKTLPYPGFPTDMQPQMCVLMCLADGVSYLNESIFENRFRYVEELKRMGANIKVDGHTAIIEGGTPLSAAQVHAHDLRAGAALVIAGLATEGRTEIEEIQHIERGYDNLVGKLQSVGADIRKVILPDSYGLAKAN
ncbi:MAG TPA: UDP-N-acetylglucosamine 1-carboxyvinyltransferase [Bacillota bacterium]|nr:UDP-N-acetylglucosamine 1-carboxyvinyltransferase [Clostridiales bacterium]HPT84427.1 UDP-N-acetylglucosamine 1-carboxyvinyltransferase [Bacillota bacterium]